MGEPVTDPWWPLKCTNSNMATIENTDGHISSPVEIILRFHSEILGSSALLIVYEGTYVFREKLVDIFILLVLGRLTCLNVCRNYTLIIHWLRSKWCHLRKHNFHAVASVSYNVQHTANTAYNFAINLNEVCLGDAERTHWILHDNIGGC